MFTETHDHTTACWWNVSQARWECSRPRAATSAAADVSTTAETASTTAESPLVDVRDMIVVHTALLREFRLAPAAVARVAAGEVRQTAIVDRHLQLLCTLLHHHHAGEDALLWPLLRARVPATAMKFVDEVEAQHVAIDASLHEVQGARARWRTDPSAANRDTVVTGLSTLYELLADHLALEERSVLPLAASVLTDEEWHAIGDAAVAAMPSTLR